MDGDLDYPAHHKHIRTMSHKARELEVLTGMQDHELRRRLPALAPTQLSQAVEPRRRLRRLAANQY
jgi:hypothetical protein